MLFCGSQLSDLLFLDSGRSRHMMRNKDKFISLTTINGGKVTFDDNAKVKVVEKGKVSRISHCFIDDVLLIEGLKHNLLSISQFCDKSNQVIFIATQCLVINHIDIQIKLVGKKDKSHLYD